MPVSPRLEVPYRTRFDECAASGSLRSSAYLRYAQEVAWVHSDASGFDRHWYRERGLTWLVRCVDLEIVGSITSGETISVSTEVLGFRRVWARRRSEFQGEGDERPRAVMIIDWVLLGANGRPARVPSEIAGIFDAPSAAFSPASVELPAAPAGVHARESRVRPHELDPLEHVNNAVYLDYLEEAVAEAGGEDDVDQVPRRYRLEYLQAAGPGEHLLGTAWEDGPGWAYRLAGRDGRELLRGRLETDPGAWVGG